jgi:hypothetical protein
MIGTLERFKVNVVRSDNVGARLPSRKRRHDRCDTIIRSAKRENYMKILYHAGVEMLNESER